MNVFTILNLNEEDKKRILQICNERNVNCDITAIEYGKFIQKIEMLQIKKVNIDIKK